MFSRRKSDISLPSSKIVCGIEVKKLPFGAYLSALRLISDELPQLMGAIYKIDKNDKYNPEPDNSFGFFSRLLERAPLAFVKLLAELVEVSHHRLLEDENIGAAGVLEIAVTFCEVNQLGKCRELLLRLLMYGKTIKEETGMLTNSGCSD